MKHNFAYAMTKYLLLPIYKLILRVKGVGFENIPESGAFIICSNHIRARDPFVIAVLSKRRIRFMAKTELYKNKLMSAYMHAIETIPVDRGHADIAAVRESLKCLKDGDALGIFPQGTRSRDNSRTHMETGIGMIALRSGAPVIPAYIDGTYKVFGRTIVRVGKPVPLADFGKKCDSESIKHATERIESAIWAMADANLEP